MFGRSVGGGDDHCVASLVCIGDPCLGSVEDVVVACEGLGALGVMYI